MAAHSPDLLRVFGAGGPTLHNVLAAIGLFAIGWAYMGSPQLFVRYMALKSVREVPQGSLVAVIYSAFATSGAALIGVCGRVLLQPLADPEQVLPALSAELFSPFFMSILLAIVLAAIMSTADSLLVLASSSITRDIWQRIFRPKYARRTGDPMVSVGNHWAEYHCCTIRIRRITSYFLVRIVCLGGDWLCVLPRDVAGIILAPTYPPRCYCRYGDRFFGDDDLETDPSEHFGADRFPEFICPRR